LNQHLEVTRRRRKVDGLIGVQVSDGCRENSGPTGMIHGALLSSALGLSAF
jgi:hypothetical protein